MAGKQKQGARASSSRASGASGGGTESSVSGPVDGPLTPDMAAGMQGAFGNSAVSGLVKGAKDEASAVFAAAASGSPASLPFKSEMEEAFGEDFSSVQAYTGQARALEGLGAEAAALGDQVVFAEANPSKEVVAHELTHVVQARKGGSGVHPAAAGVSSPRDSSEREASEVGKRVAGGGEAGAISEKGQGVQRWAGMSTGHSGTSGRSRRMTRPPSS